MASSQSDWTSWEPWTQWTLDSLCRLIQASGGTMLASEVSTLYEEAPAHWDVLRHAGGLRKFCIAHGDRLEWMPNSGPGQEQVRLRVEESEPRARRVPRLAAAFAGTLPDSFEGPLVSRQDLAEAWEAFCRQQGEPTGGLGNVLFLLKRWRSLAPAGRNRFRLVSSTTSNFRKRGPANAEGALPGQPPPLLMQRFASIVPGYDMPSEFRKLESLDVYGMQRAVERLLREDKGLTPKQIIEANFKEYQHAVLFTEELQMNYDISLYDQEVDERLAFGRGLHEVPVPGLAEKRPSVLRGDRVLLKCKQGKFLGYVHEVLFDTVKVSFNRSFQNAPPFTVHFSFNRTPLRTMHRAIDELAGSLMAATGITPSPPEQHRGLNKEQRVFLSTAKQPPEVSDEPPLLLWGPPGTGKTTTLVHTIVAIIRGQNAASVLVTAPSNPAADLLCERLAAQGVQEAEMLRLVAVQRDKRHITTTVLRFTRMDSTDFFKVPELEELQRQRIVVSTCTTAAYLRSRMRRRSESWFTHVFVDEAAQAMEAEVLVPLTLRKPFSRIFLAGDFKQLGPVIRSPVAISFGLDVPLMERIVQTISVTHSRVITLLETYRAHPSILKLYNKTVYGDVLRCRSPSSSSDMTRWPDCPKDADGNAHPIIFHHCNGQESRTKASPSWQNVDEANVVKTYLMRLLAYGVEAKDVGIISPYHQQCQRLRTICLGEGVDIEVGTTELFQGREKRVIIISIVRSRNTEELASDFRFALGFLGNFKRTNVALSRAKSLLIVVGNLALLSADATWHNVIALVRSMQCLRGSAFESSQPIYGENSEWVGTAAVQNGVESTFDGAADRPWRDGL